MWYFLILIAGLIGFIVFWADEIFFFAVIVALVRKLTRKKGRSVACKGFALRLKQAWDKVSKKLE